MQKVLSAVNKGLMKALKTWNPYNTLTDLSMASLYFQNNLIHKLILFYPESVVREKFLLIPHSPALSFPSVMAAVPS